MDSIKTKVNDGKGHLKIFKSSPLINDLGEVLDGSKNEIVTFVTSYQANIYIGTSLGRILHYHRFSDIPNYMLISQIEVSHSQESIMKIELVEEIERVVILAGSIASTYTLPELSTCHMGKLKDVRDISVAPNIADDKKNDKVKGQNIVVLGKDNISLISMKKDSIHMIKRIGYKNGIKVLVIKPKNNENALLALIANDTTYDIIDLKMTRKIPLFEYNPAKILQNQIAPQIVSFQAGDKEGENEYMLTIQSDTITCLSMFINDTGDVTRGTIVWGEEGVPVNECIINWPFAIGIFWAEDGNYSVKFSSLESLETVYTSKLCDILGKSSNENRDEEREVNEENDSKSDNGRPIQIPESVSYRLWKASNISLPEKEISSLFSIVQIGDNKKTEAEDEVETNILSASLIYEDSQIWILHEQEELLDIQQLCEEWLKTDQLSESFTEKVNSLSNKYDGKYLQYLSQMRFIMTTLSDKKDICIDSLYNMHTDDFSIDPRLIFYLLDENVNGNDVTNDLEIFSGLLPLIEKVKSLNFDKDNLLWSIITKYYKLLTRDDALASVTRKTIYSKLSTDDSALEFLSKNDSDYFSSKSEEEEEISRSFKDRNFLKTLLFVLDRQNFDKNSNEDSAVKVCKLSLKILNDSDNEVEEDYKTSLIEKIFENLSSKISDSKTYEYILLEVLKVDVNKGIDYLKQHIKSKFSAIHKEILEKLTSTSSEISTLSHLKFEYLESSFLEEGSISALDELILHLTTELEKQHQNYIVSNNFTSLISDFKVENSLTNTHWLKIGWIEFLQVHKQNSECKEFVDLYLKLFELLQIRIYNYSQPRSHLDELLKDDLFSYMRILIDKANQINHLINYSDYSTAEFVALNGMMPIPRVLFYNITIKQYDRLPEFSVKKNLEFIFSFYMNNDLDHHGKCIAAKHFIESFGEKFFSPLEVINMVPDNTPLVYLSEYLVDVLLKFRSRKTEVSLKKTLLKRESAFVLNLYHDIISQSP